MKRWSPHVLSLLCLLIGCREGAYDPDISAGDKTSPYTSEEHAQKLEEVKARIHGYISEFEEHTGQRSLGIQVYFHSNCSIGLGRCLNFFDRRAISFSKDYMDHLIKTDTITPNLEMLVFHELGHCILERSHALAPSADASLGSIMWKGKAKSYAYHKAYYIDELIDPLAPKLDFETLPVDREDLCQWGSGSTQL